MKDDEIRALNKKILAAKKQSSSKAEELEQLTTLRE
jgi:hypothetical protein